MFAAWNVIVHQATNTMITLLCQRDPRWAQVNLGASTLTVGRYGCTTTSMSMLTSYFGTIIFPDAIAKIITNYTPDGLVLWQNLSFPQMKFEKRLTERNDVEILKSLQDPNRAVILNVSHGSHWIVAIRKTLFGGDFVCADPWTGKKCNAVGSYQNIVGSAHFVRV